MFYRDGSHTMNSLVLGTKIKGNRCLSDKRSSVAKSCVNKGSRAAESGEDVIKNSKLTYSITKI